jgi:WD40 repeat protein
MLWVILLISLGVLLKFWFSKRLSESKKVVSPPPPEVPKKKVKKVDITAHAKSKNIASTDNALSHPLLMSVYRGHKQEVVSVDLRHDGQLLASVDSEQLRVWVVSDFPDHAVKVLNLESSATAVKFSPDGTRLAIALGGSERRVQIRNVGCESKDGRLWAVVEDKMTASFPTQHTHDIGSLAWGVGGSCIVTCTHGADTKIGVWSLSGACLFSVNSHKLRHNQMAMCADHRFVAAAAGLADVKVWELCYDKSVDSHFAGPPRKIDVATVLTAHERAVQCVAFGPRGLIATTSLDGKWRVFELSKLVKAGADAKLLHVHAVPPGPQVTHQLFAAEGRVMVFGAGPHVLFAEVNTGRELERITMKKGQVTSLCLSRDEAFVAVSGGSRDVKLFRVPEVFTDFISVPEFVFVFIVYLSAYTFP